jgi:hypothetical protein
VAAFTYITDAVMTTATVPTTDTIIADSGARDPDTQRYAVLTVKWTGALVVHSIVANKAAAKCTVEALARVKCPAHFDVARADDCPGRQRRQQ